MEKIATNLSFLQKYLNTKTVIISYIINDCKNCKGIMLSNFDINFDSETIIITDNQNLEILYPFNEIIDIEIDILRKECKLHGLNNESLLLTVV